MRIIPHIVQPCTLFHLNIKIYVIILIPQLRVKAYMTCPRLHSLKMTVYMQNISFLISGQWLLLYWEVDDSYNI